MQRKEIKGERFGRLVAVEKRGSGKWLFLCDCGQQREMYHIL